MGDAKGKGRASDTEEFKNLPAVERPYQNPDSLIGRVLTSATGLARDALAAPASNELSDRSSAALASAGKAQQTGGNGSSAWAENSRSAQSNGVPSSRAAQMLPAETFRTQIDEHISNAEAEFSTFLDSIDPFQPAPVAGLESSRADMHREGASFGTSGGLARTTSASHRTYATVREQQAHDGEAVSAILSDHTHQPSETADLYERWQEDEPIKWTMTPAQRAEWQERLRVDFPPTGVQQGPDVNHPLNLMPQMELPGLEARDEWVAQWRNVLTRYSDEVWGDLLPLVHDAQEEVSAMEGNHSGTATDQPKALRRLGLVLGHLRE
ncbi:MAG: hypothetical protein M1818_000747 [Claussenomyces sp. TS43310]|nr:MAG: hypothetical protein M1818_000747 [Claussenomyces sp. TS43310]